MASDFQESDGLKEIPASEILAKIEKGEPVDYDHVIIKGDMIATKLDLPKENGSFIILSTIIIKNSRIEGVFLFNNVIFEDSVEFLGTHFSRFANFEESLFCKSADFTRSDFGETVFFRKCQFDEFAVFEDAQFNGGDFSESIYNEGAIFRRSEFKDYIDFKLSEFSNITDFNRVRFGGYVNFWRAKFTGHTEFSGSVFAEVANFWESQFDSEFLTFRGANFNLPSSQENACRKAKNLLEKNGNREEAGYHFYREMEGKRKQKPWHYSYPEFVFIQLIFGYGVHPWRLMLWWLIIVVAFAILYGVGNGITGATEWFDYIKVSFATAIAPGYIAAIINPCTGYKLTAGYQAVAMTETIVGTFMWAGFIATFAKKYMR